MRTQQNPGSGSRRASSRSAGSRPSRRPPRKSRFMLHTRLRCSSASRWNGQLAKAISLRGGDGLVPVATQDIEHGGPPIGELAEQAGDGGGLLTDHPASGTGGGGQALAGRGAAAFGLGDRRRQQRAHEVAAPLRDRRRDLLGASPVERGRPPGTGAGPPARALEGDLDDPRVGELVEVKRGHRPGHAERLGGLGGSDPPVTLGQQSVEVAAQGWSSAAMPAMRRSRSSGCSTATQSKTASTCERSVVCESGGGLAAFGANPSACCVSRAG